MKTGDELPNGAIVLLERSGVILAINNCGNDDEYVTWEWDGKNPASTSWGHYHRSLEAAAYDFESRFVRKEKRNAKTNVGNG